MDDDVLVVDCCTGEHVRRAPTPDEKAQRVQDEADHTALQDALARAAAGRDATLSKVASASGVAVDDLKQAMGVAEVTPTPPRGDEAHQPSKRGA